VRGEIVRSSRLFLLAIGVGWIAITLLVDAQLVAVDRSIDLWPLLRLRLLGLALILAGYLLVRRESTPHWPVMGTVAAAGAITTAIVGASSPATTYAMVPVVWCLALAAIVAPRPRIGGAMAGAWLVAFVLGALVHGDHVTTLLPIVPLWAAAVAATLLVNRRLWQLRHDLYDARRLGKYRLLSPIGQGGMNDVWLAWDEARRREVALKLLRTSGAADATRARFEREAQLVRMLRSPHIVRTYDFGMTGDGFAYIALEYLRGLDLEALVHAHGPIEPRRAIRLMRQACRGLGDAHDAGVIHRDVKPANIHCSDQRGAEDLVRILDFGVAGSITEEASPGGVVVGTPAYMAPEAFSGSATTPASDVYALGATFYFAITGVPPIDGDTPYALQRAHERAPVVPPSLRAGVDVPRAFEKIILRCLAKAPEDRFENANAVGEALDEVIPAIRSWSREDAVRWWRHARTGAIAVPRASTEHTTDVEVVKLPSTVRRS